MSSLFVNIFSSRLSLVSSRSHGEFPGRDDSGYSRDLSDLQQTSEPASKRASFIEVFVVCTIVIICWYLYETKVCNLCNVNVGSTIYGKVTGIHAFHEEPRQQSHYRK
jgi:hypothetical protein